MSILFVQLMEKLGDRPWLVFASVTFADGTHLDVEGVLNGIQLNDIDDDAGTTRSVLNIGVADSRDQPFAYSFLAMPDHIGFRETEDGGLYFSQTQGPATIRMHLRPDPEEGSERDGHLFLDLGEL
jgi:hypothetical protein